MKIRTHISATLGDPVKGGQYPNVTINQEQLDQLARILPKGKGRGGFSAELSESDPRLDEIVHLIYTWTGKLPRFSRLPLSSKEYLVSRTRDFSTKELESSGYFSISASHFIGNLDGQTLGGQLIIKHDKAMQERIQIGGVPPSMSVAIAKESKALLENETLCGLTFREVLFSKKLAGGKELSFQTNRQVDISWLSGKTEVLTNQQSQKPLWQLTSTITLPPVLNAVVDSDKQELFGGSRKVCFMEDEALPVILRYRRIDIEQLPPFDVAITLETVGSCERNATSLVVVSRKFRNLVNRWENVGIQFVPVHLE